MQVIFGRFYGIVLRGLGTSHQSRMLHYDGWQIESMTIDINLRGPNNFPRTPGVSPAGLVSTVTDHQ